VPEGRFHGWQAFAAVLGAVAAVLTACVAAATFLRAGDGDGASPSPTVDAARTTPAGGGSPGATGGDGSTPAPAPPLVDDLALRLEGYIEFDLDPPDVDPPGTEVDLGLYGTGSNKVRGFNGAAIWSGATDPGRDQCDHQMRTKGTREFVTVDVGSLLCVRTSGGRTVLVRFVKANRDGTWDVEATVWRA
jgi:hypothetical protein